MQSLLLANPMFGTYDEGVYIFTLAVQYYAIFIVCGMILAAALSALLMKRRNMDPAFIFTLFIICIPSAIVGARLFSCLTDGSLRTHSFGAWLKYLVVPPWRGLSIVGGVIGGVLSGFLVCLGFKVNFLRAADCVVINILFAQALGRWGNYFNGEVYGGVVTNPALQFFPFAVFEGGEWHYAFFFYEMVINLIGWALLFTFTWYRKSKPNGISTCLYFVWYGTVRTIMEPFREAQYQLGIWSELFAILMMGLGIIAIEILLIVNFRREGAFIGSRNGDPCGISRYLSADKKSKPYYSKINIFGKEYPPKPEKKKDRAKDGSSGPSSDEGKEE